LTSPRCKTISGCVNDSPADQSCRTRVPYPIQAVFALIGFTAVIAQIVLMRELMVVFCGNEMSLGVMLAAWLLWTAIGSGTVGRWAGRTQQARRLVVVLELLSALAFPVALVLVRASKAFFQIVPGELLGPGPVLATSLIVLSVFCFVSGGLFAAGSRLFALEAASSTAVGTSRVYLLEAMGSGAGGVLASLVLIRYLQPFEIAAVFSLLNLVAAVGLTIRVAAWRKTAIVALLMIFAVLVFPFGCRRLERASLDRLWHGFRLVAMRNSVYGNLAVVQTGGIRTLFENGLVAFNAPDPAAAEEAVHFALLEHAAPKSMLLIGGGVNGSLTQALQYASLERVDYVELDPAILKLAQHFFTAEWAPIRADPRVHVYNADGRLFLKTTELKFDVVIVNLPEPQTAQLNRFYTVEFFREVAAKLNSGGVFSFQVKGAEDYIGPELAEFLRCIRGTLRAVFPDVVVIPGDMVHFFASAQAGSLTVDPQELVARLRSRQIRTSYVREYYLPYRMAPDRMLDLDLQLRAQAHMRINRDFAPVAYYFDVALWNMQFNREYRHVFQNLAQVRFGRLFAGTVAMLVVFVVLAHWAPRKQEDPWQASSAFCVGAMGFTLIGLEMLLLLAFQAIYGYVYQQLAIIIAGFMVGMAVGSWRGSIADRLRRRLLQSDVRKLVVLQILAALSPLLLCSIAPALATTLKPSIIFIVSHVIFPLLAVACGFMGGYQFPIASRVFFAESKTHAKSPGALYALDLTGACLGALVLSTYLVPVFGFQQTAWLMVVLNLAPAVLVALLAWGKQAVPS
jgi:spermidine synthase